MNYNYGNNELPSQCSRPNNPYCL